MVHQAALGRTSELEEPKSLSPASDLRELKASLSEKGVKFALASYVDVHGKMKAKCVPLSHLESMMGGSELFTGAALDGVPQDISDHELSAVPDRTSCVQLPWKPEL